MCAAWQLSVPAIGLTCSDQRQPGWKVARPTGAGVEVDQVELAAAGLERADLLGFVQAHPDQSSAVSVRHLGSSDWWLVFVSTGVSGVRPHSAHEPS